MPGLGCRLVTRLFDEAFNDQNYAVLGEIVATDYIEHAVAPFGREEPGRVQGPEFMRGVIEWLRAQFPDVAMRILDCVADGDRVAVRVASQGTNTGPVNGRIPATGRTFCAEASHWYRVADGRLVEHWAVRDDLGTMIQLGLVPAPGPG